VERHPSANVGISQSITWLVPFTKNKRINLTETSFVVEEQLNDSRELFFDPELLSLAVYPSGLRVGIDLPFQQTHGVNP